MTPSIDDDRRFYADEIRFVASVESPALVQAFAREPREKSGVKPVTTKSQRRAADAKCAAGAKLKVIQKLDKIGDFC